MTITHNSADQTDCETLIGSLDFSLCSRLFRQVSFPKCNYPFHTFHNIKPLHRAAGSLMYPHYGVLSGYWSCLNLLINRVLSKQGTKKKNERFITGNFVY